MSERALVKLVNASKTYWLGGKPVHALKRINLSLKRGEFVVVLGKSGSGKSTLLNLIGCLDKPTSGKVFFEGKDVTKLSEGELAEIRNRKVGFVFQTFNLIPTLNVFENVELPLLLRGVEREKRRKMVKSLLREVGLLHRLDHKPSQLSGGEQQRVAIARALVNEPELILADEPTGNLDAKSGEIVLKLLIRAREKRNATLVIVTHDTSIANLAEHVIYLYDGRIIKEVRRRRKKRG